MAKYQFSTDAENDLTDIWNYTLETWSEGRAEKYYTKLLRTCQTIADNPSIGKNYEHVRANLLGFRVGKHIIFYRVITDDEIKVVRILHESMDLPNRLLD